MINRTKHLVNLTRKEIDGLPHGNTLDYVAGVYDGHKAAIKGQDAIYHNHIPLTRKGANGALVGEAYSPVAVGAIISTPLVGILSELAYTKC